MYGKFLQRRGLIGVSRTLMSSHSSTNAARRTVDVFGVLEESRDELENNIQGVYMGPAPNIREDKELKLSMKELIEKGEEGKLSAENTKIYLRSKYRDWIKSKYEKDLLSDPTAESVFTPHYGEIRFDRRNPIKFDGQFDEKFFQSEDVYANESEALLGKYSGLQPKPIISSSQNAYSSQSNATSETRESPVGSENSIPGSKSRKLDVQIVSDHAQGKTKSELHSRSTPQAHVMPEQISRTGYIQPQADNVSRVSSSGNNNNKSDPQKKPNDGKKLPFTTGVPSGPQKDQDTAISEESSVNKHTNTTPTTAKEFVQLMKMAEKQTATDKPEGKVGGRTFEIPTENIIVEKSRVPKVYTPFPWNDTENHDVWIYLKKQICFENEFLVAINKPWGLPVHSATNDCRHTLIHFLSDFAKYCKVDKVYPCHRLDKDTTGVLLLAKSNIAADIIKAKFADRSIIKQYFAIVKNCPDVREGTIKIPIGEGKVPNSGEFKAKLKPDLEKYSFKTKQTNCREAITWFKVLSSHKECAFVEIRPETGVTHQIRVHLAQGLGCPILGDHKYSHTDKLAPQRLHPQLLKNLKVEQAKVRYLPMHLHCSKIQFTMPDSFLTTRYKEPVFVHARPSPFFMRSLKALNLK